MSNFEGNNNAAKVVAGLKGGMWFKNLNFPQPMNFVDGVHPMLKQKLQQKEAPSLKMGSNSGSFNSRYK